MDFKHKDNDAKSKPPEPWRTSHNVGLLTLKDKIERYTPPSSTGIHQARIMMIGQTGAGKSSFCNTICSIFSGEIKHPSPCGSGGKSFATVYRQYHVRSNGTNTDLKFCLCDTCGIVDGERPNLEDIKYLLHGSIPDEYEFDVSKPINPTIRGFRKRPGLEDQVHCVAFVIDGSTAEGLNDTVWDTLRKVQDEICRREIPRVFLLTKVDRLCTDGDISNVFLSSQVENAVKKVSEMLGIPAQIIHPMKNYDTEMQLKDEISHLALTALDKMITDATDVLERKCSSLSRIKPWRQPGPDLNRESMQTLMEKIKTYAPPSYLGIPFARILMIGPVDAGKSSFFNTINSVFTGRITQKITDGSTTVYRQYQIQTLMTGAALKFRLCDTCGVENRQNSYLKDLMYIIEGNVPDGYKFNSSTPIGSSIPNFKMNPGLEDKVHRVVFVLDASTIETTAESIYEELNELQTRLNSISLPRAVLLTKIDKVSQPLHDDLSTVFSSVDVGEAVQKVAQKRRVPANKIYPIKNYENEISLNDITSTLSLLALDQILGYADDYFSSQENIIKKKNNYIWFLIAGLVLLIAIIAFLLKLCWS